MSRCDSDSDHPDFDNAITGSLLQCVSGVCSVLQGVAECCSELQRVVLCRDVI